MANEARIEIFRHFLNTFESDELRDYCTDMLLKTSLEFWSMNTAAYDQPGGLIMQTLVGCGLCDCTLKNTKSMTFPKPKQRDSIRIATCFRYLQPEWIMETKVVHDIKPELKKYISDLIKNYNKPSNEAQDVVYWSSIFSKVNLLTDDIRDIIQETALIDPNEYFLPSWTKYPTCSFLMTLELDKEYLKSIKDDSRIKEPFRTFLKEYL